MYVAKTFFFEAFLEAFGGLLRPKETSGEVLPGAFYFLIGIAIVVSGLVTTDMRIARYAVECLALADPMASWIGSTIPSPKLTIATDKNGGTRTSSLSGCLACFGTALGVGWWMLASHDDDSMFAPFTLVAGALACTIAEGLPFGNDNLNIPVITAFVVDRFAAASGTSVGR
jgi:dolichol kinase